MKENHKCKRRVHARLLGSLEYMQYALMSRLNAYLKESPSQLSLFLKMLLIFCFQSAAKFELGRAQESLDWIEAVTGKNLDYPEGGSEIRDQKDFGSILQNGHLLCE